MTNLVQVSNCLTVCALLPLQDYNYCYTVASPLFGLHLNQSVILYSWWVHFSLYMLNINTDHGDTTDHIPFIVHNISNYKAFNCSLPSIPLLVYSKVYQLSGNIDRVYLGLWLLHGMLILNVIGISLFNCNAIAG